MRQIGVGAACGAALFCVTTAVSAAPSMGEVYEHNALLTAIKTVGVEVAINEKEHCYTPWLDGQVAGAYDGGSKVLALCQDNK